MDCLSKPTMLSRVGTFGFVFIFFLTPKGTLWPTSPPSLPPFQPCDPPPKPPRHTNFHKVSMDCLSKPTMLSRVGTFGFVFVSFLTPKGTLWPTSPPSPTVQRCFAGFQDGTIGKEVLRQSQLGVASRMACLLQQ